MGESPSRAAIVAAFASVYVIWGSTYLAIRFLVHDAPPFLSAGARWLLAGAALYAWRRARGDPRPTLIQWRSAAIVGALLILGGNGIVSYAEQIVPSGLTALLIAIVPVWIALLVWGQTRVAPTARVAAGIGLGLAGVALLIGPQAFGGGPLVGILLVVLASMSWATGSIYSRKASLPKSVLLGASMEMLCGGALLALAGLVRGEAARVDLAAVSWTAWLSLAFLVLFGSIVAYSAYVWLLQVARPELVATYAFVNPIVAVALGVAFADETLTGLTLAAAAIIVVAVAVVVTAPARAPRRQATAVEQV